MKIKTSITLSEELLVAIDQLASDFKNRSDLIEQAVRIFIDMKVRAIRDEQDAKILKRKAKQLNRETEDVLSYQSEL